MEVINETKLYENFLLDILNNQDKPFDEAMQKPLKLNIYLALLSLNNNNYQDSFFTEEHRIIDDFLRKVNNLKVKIQLKRKQTEIDKLHKEITSIIKEYPLVIEIYNLESLVIEPIINSQEPDKITVRRALSNSNGSKSYSLSAGTKYFVPSSNFNNE